MHPVWSYITDFGDASVTVPLAIFTAIYLLAAGWRRAALAWTLAVGGCGATMVILKLGIRACGTELAAITLTSPSGHAAMSTIVYGGLDLLLASLLSGWRKPAVVMPMALVIGAIAVSRILLGAHSRLEVLIGLLVGLGYALLLYLMLRRAPPPPFSVRRLGAGAIVIILLLHGLHLPVEQVLVRIATRLHHALPFCA